MPGRKYSAGSGYRYGFNGQEKSDELGEGFTTAEFWEYDSRIGRRWNIDPVTDDTESPYVCFSNNPLFNIDPNGNSDSTYKTPGNGTVTTNDPGARTFDGNVLTVGEKKVKIQPAKGTLWSFTVRRKDVADGAVRFVAKFNTETGAFEGYGWDKDMSYTYSDLLKDIKNDLIEQDEQSNNPLYQHYDNPTDAKKSVLNLGIGLVLPNLLLKTGTATANASKTVAISSEETVNSSNVLLNSSRQLQAKFKHALDFGVKGNYNKANAAQFSSALNKHINSAQVIQGTYRGQAVIHYLNTSTGVNVITKVSGEFISGWKLGLGQLKSVLKNGVLW